MRVCAVKAVWATVELFKRDENLITGFHKFSVTVWAIWLIPYLSPMVIMIAKPA